MNELIRLVEQETLRQEPLADFNVGDTVKVHVKIKEEKRVRTQIFEGTVIKIQNGGSRKTFTVRRVAMGTGVERTFPIHSPRVEKVEVMRRGLVRRARLYYLRKLVGKAATRVKEIR